MRTKLLCILALAFVLASCLKNETASSNCNLSTAVAPAPEVAALQAYLTANSIIATPHSSGLFYSISNPGAGTTPSGCSAVTVKYIGKLTNGTAFDSSYKSYPNGITFALNNLISGWQIGIPLIKKGGSITLYLPPYLGYGSTGSGAAVPPNSNLVFNIELVDVQ